MRTRIDELRRFGGRLIAAFAWAITAALFTLTALYEPDGFVLFAASAMFSLIATVFALKGDMTERCRLVMGAVAAAQPLLLSAALQSQSWVSETHQLYLVALVALIFLCDYRPIAVASIAIVAIESLSLLGVFGHGPEGHVTFAHVGIQLGAVITVSGILLMLTVEFGKIMTRLGEAQFRSEAQTKLLAERTRDLEKALQKVEKERESREQLKAKTLEVRKAEYAQIAREFEQSVSAIAHTVSSTAKLLEKTTKALDQVARETDGRASEVAGSAEAAKKSAAIVARGVAELSGSIANIAVNVSQQKEMTTRATERSSGGGSAVESLAERSDTIGEATHAIVRIAERTNLLSLNAAIEAASAGPAGRGFTIVAHEVKALAQQAGVAATEINDLLRGVRDGTLEAERSFHAIDAVVADLDQAAISIRRDVETQRQSADTIESFARTAAEEVGIMAERSKSLATTAQNAKQLSKNLDRATEKLLETVQTLENSAERFSAHLRSA